MDEQLENRQEKRRFWWLSLSFLIVVFDQISKWYVVEAIMRPRASGGGVQAFFDWYINRPPPLSFISIEITSFFNLVMAWNTGVSFSMFSGYGGYMPYILIAVALVITGLFITWMWNEQRQIFGICYALVIGGAIGNVIDRARFGAVIDFLDFHIFGYHWPAFNVADMSVVGGIALLILVSLIFDLRSKQGYRKQE